MPRSKSFAETVKIAFAALGVHANEQRAIENAKPWLQAEWRDVDHFPN
jgi:hypothetical protein